MGSRTSEWWAQKLYYDLAFAAPEMHMTHMILRFQEAIEEALMEHHEADNALSIYKAFMSGRAICPVCERRSK